jgi:hypothetical protein
MEAYKACYGLRFSGVLFVCEVVTTAVSHVKLCMPHLRGPW